MALSAAPSLIEHFSALEDPRQFWKVVYPLPELLLVVLCGTLAGADDFVEIGRWGQVHRKREPTPTLRRSLELTRFAALVDGVGADVGERGLIRGA